MSTDTRIVANIDQGFCPTNRSAVLALEHSPLSLILLGLSGQSSYILMDTSRGFTKELVRCAHGLAANVSV
jgi:hypothetical protein